MKRPSDSLLWGVALGLSLAGNLVVLLLWALFTRYQAIRLTQTPASSSTSPAAQIIQVFPMREVAQNTPQEPPRKAQAVRTSEDQRSRRPTGPAMIGERDTTATSDRPPDPNAPALPQQAGINPKDPLDLETTESDYQDGALVEAAPPPAEISPLPIPPQVAAPDEPLTPLSAEPTPPPVRETQRLFDGPKPVEVAKRETPKPVEETPDLPSTLDPHAPKQPAKDEKAFSGFQRKTAIRGSISRTGRSALDVADTPLGRYQALISRAVELEWQRNCVRHRDFITPGFLTARFFVESNGKVSHVEFIGEMETGQVQKGFTLNSIRNAKIPAMPANLQNEFDDEALELIFNFYF